jgi:hypothetical protein
LANEVRNHTSQFYLRTLDSSFRFRLTDECKDVIGNSKIKEDLYFNGDDINEQGLKKIELQEIPPTPLFQRGRRIFFVILPFEKGG